MKKHAVRILLRAVVLLAMCELSIVQAQNNGPPQVSLLWPDSRTFLSVFLDIKIKAEAKSPDGSIVKVQFLVLNNLIGVVTNPPFNLLWSVESGFTNQFTDDLVFNAVATDNFGLSTTSAPAHVFLFFGGPPAPIMKITSPENSAVFAAPATFLVSAELLASLAGTGPEEFFLGTNSLGVVNTNGLNEPFTAETPPVSVTVSNLAQGSYKLSVHDLGYDGGWCFCSSISIQVVDLAAVSPRFEPDGRFEFDVVTAFPGKQTVIEGSSNLLSWTAISTNQPSGTTFTFVDPSPVADSNRFYRVLVPAQ